jgi:streptogramin lyase
VDNFTDNIHCNKIKMKSLYLQIICLFLSFVSISQTSNDYSWRYYTPGNTGIMGDNVEAVYIDHDGNPYFAGYTTGWEEGGFSKLLQSENTWINYSNIEYPAIGSTYVVGAPRYSEIVEATDGKLWMAGWRGILSFDPAIGAGSIQFWGADNSLHPGGRTMDIDIAPDGSVWGAIQSVTWGGGGLVKFDPESGQWKYWGYGSSANNWPSNIGFCENVSIRDKGQGNYEVWVDGEGWNTMIVFDNETQLFTLLPQNQESGEVVALPGKDCIDDAGNLWVLRYSAPGEPFTLDYLTPDNIWISPVQLSAGIINDIWAFSAISDSGALVAGYDSEVWQFDGNVWNSKGVWGSDTYTYSLDADDQGNIWTSGTGGGAKRDVATGLWQRYRVTNSSQIDYWVQDMDIDANGDVWMTGNAGSGIGGFQRFDGTQWTGFNEYTYGLGYGFPFPTDNTMEIYRRPSNGDVIINPMYNGLHGWNSNGYYDLPGSFTESKGLTEDSEGRLWNLGVYYALQYFDNNSWHDVDFIGSGANITIDPTLPGTVWACSEHYLLRTDGSSNYSKIVDDFPELDPQSDVFSTVVPATEGVVWFGSNKGLFRLNTNNNTYEIFNNTNSEILGESFTPLAFTPDGRIWFTSFGSSNPNETGLGWYDGTDFGFFPVVDGGLPHSQIIDAEVKANENGYELWLSCLSRGIAVLEVVTNPVGITSGVIQETGITVQNYPNPFSNNTTISFSLASADHVNLSIYTITGIPVAVLADKQMNAGKWTVDWNIDNTDQGRMSPGIYIAELTTSTVSKSIRLVVQ